MKIYFQYYLNNVLETSICVHVHRTSKRYNNFIQTIIQMYEDR